MTKRVDRDSGFTLVEVLIALLILVVAMTAWQLRISEQLDSAAYLREKTLAQWVALNQLALLRTSSRLGQSEQAPQLLRGTTQLADRTWYWQIAPLDASLAQATTGDSTLEQQLVPVVVSVSDQNANAAANAPLFTVTGVAHAANVEP